ncbi:hypothetical protein [Pedobacter zeae]|uniref:Uncharacterized protein n=1 Tax=Pedobacter zeae TaxID=1737356 RepID=A0A7W6P4A9_9SPHI|nr:hypothetical protein [Pedobacter zeae]MBB4106747.1 hypothetical protein [Pedobacter zeae]GGH03507.1 hypothetical protein GCM10007422_18600 [Pedobacter zeae]
MKPRLDYFPKQSADVSASDYSYGISILGETYQKVKSDQGVFNYADYWNIAVALVRLKTDAVSAKEYLYQSKKLNENNFAQIFEELGGGFDAWEYCLLRTEYDVIKAECAALNAKNNASILKGSGNLPVPKRRDKGKGELIDLLNGLMENDQRYRTGSVENRSYQQLLDRENLSVIDELYKKYNTYLGKSLVGEAHSTVMWLIIQHSSLESMEKYLPCIIEAVRTRELAAAPLKMLLDRIASISYGYQYYGTQKGVPMASAEIIGMINKKYGNVYPEARTAEKFRLVTNQKNF